MKKLMLAAMLAMSLGLLAGCATPGYSGGPPTLGYVPDRGTGEHANRVLRNWNYETQQAVDDLDMVLLMDSASHLTKWNVR
jgi:hypothetical protein